MILIAFQNDGALDKVITQYSRGPTPLRTVLSVTTDRLVARLNNAGETSLLNDAYEENSPYFLRSHRTLKHAEYLQDN